MLRHLQSTFYNLRSKIHDPQSNQKGSITLALSALVLLGSLVGSVALSPITNFDVRQQASNNAPTLDGGSGSSNTCPTTCNAGAHYCREGKRYECIKYSDNCSTVNGKNGVWRFHSNDPNCTTNGTPNSGPASTAVPTGQTSTGATAPRVNRNCFVLGKNSNNELVCSRKSISMYSNQTCRQVNSNYYNTQADCDTALARRVTTTGSGSNTNTNPKPQESGAGGVDYGTDPCRSWEDVDGQPSYTAPGYCDIRGRGHSSRESALQSAAVCRNGSFGGNSECGAGNLSESSLEYYNNLPSVPVVEEAQNQAPIVAPTNYPPPTCDRPVATQCSWGPHGTYAKLDNRTCVACDICSTEPRGYTVVAGSNCGIASTEEPASNTEAPAPEPATQQTQNSSCYSKSDNCTNPIPRNIAQSGPCESAGMYSSQTACQAPTYQCYFGVSSCSQIGRQPADSTEYGACNACSNTSSGACCGARVSTSNRECVPGSRTCVDVSGRPGLKICTQSGTWTPPQACSGDRVCSIGDSANPICRTPTPVTEVQTTDDTVSPPEQEQTSSSCNNGTIVNGTCVPLCSSIPNFNVTNYIYSTNTNQPPNSTPFCTVSRVRGQNYIYHQCNSGSTKQNNSCVSNADQNQSAQIETCPEGGSFMQGLTRSEIENLGGIPCRDSEGVSYRCPILGSTFNSETKTCDQGQAETTTSSCPRGRRQALDQSGNPTGECQVACTQPDSNLLPETISLPDNAFACINSSGAHRYQCKLFYVIDGPNCRRVTGGEVVNGAVDFVVDLFDGDNDQTEESADTNTNSGNTPNVCNLPIVNSICGFVDNIVGEKKPTQAMDLCTDVPAGTINCRQNQSAPNGRLSNHECVQLPNGKQWVDLGSACEHPEGVVETRSKPVYYGYTDELGNDNTISCLTNAKAQPICAISTTGQNSASFECIQNRWIKISDGDQCVLAPQLTDTQTATCSDGSTPREIRVQRNEDGTATCYRRNQCDDQWNNNTDYYGQVSLEECLEFLSNQLSVDPNNTPNPANVPALNTCPGNIGSRGEVRYSRDLQGCFVRTACDSSLVPTDGPYWSRVSYATTESECNQITYQQQVNLARSSSNYNNEEEQTRESDCWYYLSNSSQNQCYRGFGNICSQANVASFSDKEACEASRNPNQQTTQSNTVSCFSPSYENCARPRPVSAQSCDAASGNYTRQNECNNARQTTANTTQQPVCWFFRSGDEQIESSTCTIGNSQTECNVSGINRFTNQDICNQNLSGAKANFTSTGQTLDNQQPTCWFFQDSAIARTPSCFPSYTQQQCNRAGYTTFAGTEETLCNSTLESRKNGEESISTETIGAGNTRGLPICNSNRGGLFMGFGSSSFVPPSLSEECFDEAAYNRYKEVNQEPLVYQCVQNARNNNNNGCSCNTMFTQQGNACVNIVTAAVNNVTNTILNRNYCDSTQNLIISTSQPPHSDECTPSPGSGITVGPTQKAYECNSNAHTEENTCVLNTETDTASTNTTTQTEECRPGTRRPTSDIGALESCTIICTQPRTNLLPSSASTDSNGFLCVNSGNSLSVQCRLFHKPDFSTNSCVRMSTGEVVSSVGAVINNTITALTGGSNDNSGQTQTQQPFYCSIPLIGLICNDNNQTTDSNSDQTEEAQTTHHSEAEFIILNCAKNSGDSEAISGYGNRAHPTFAEPTVGYVCNHLRTERQGSACTPGERVGLSGQNVFFCDDERYNELTPEEREALVEHEEAHILLQESEGRALHTYCTNREDGNNIPMDDPTPGQPSYTQSSCIGFAELGAQLVSYEELGDDYVFVLNDINGNPVDNDATTREAIDHLIEQCSSDEETVVSALLGNSESYSQLLESGCNPTQIVSDRQRSGTEGENSIGEDDPILDTVDTVLEEELESIGNPEVIIENADETHQ